MCCCLTTHKLKLLVVVLTLIVAVDGLLKFSSNATLMLYYSSSIFRFYLICRLVLGLLLAIWAFVGFLTLFYDSVCGVATYASGICVLTVFDCLTLFYRFHMNAMASPRVLGNGVDIKHIRTSSADVVMMEEGLEDAMLVFLIVVQICVNITGWHLSFRLRHYQSNEEQFVRDSRRLDDMRTRMQQGGARSH